MKKPSSILNDAKQENKITEKKYSAVDVKPCVCERLDIFSLVHDFFGQLIFLY